MTKTKSEYPTPIIYLHNENFKEKLNETIDLKMTTRKKKRQQEGGGFLKKVSSLFNIDTVICLFYFRIISNRKNNVEKFL